MNLLATCDGQISAIWLWVARQSISSQLNLVSEDLFAKRDRDVELLRRISKGDRLAFSEFYDLYSTLFFSVAVRILHDQKEAEDVVQDVFIQIWEKSGGFDPRLGQPVNWAMTFVRNKAIDRIRASQRRARLVETATEEASPVPPGLASANEFVCGREKAELIRSAVTGLPAEQRQAIELAFFSGLTQNEISEQLREPLGTVKARIRRGMLKLREKLGGVHD